LTNLFKAFTARFGQNYVDKVIEKLARYITSVGELKLRAPSNSEKAIAQKMILTVLRAIMKSAPLVPREFRHMASILRGVTTYRFNKKQAIFNTLSGFFSLRFINGSLSIWQDSTKTAAGPSAEGGAPFLIQFAQLLQSPLSMMIYCGSSETFADWNHHLIKHIFPDLVAFTLSLADLDEIPEYQPPNAETVKKAVGSVLDAMNENKDKFEKRYTEVTSRNIGLLPATWALGTFLLAFFRPSTDE
jgi:hypothetical protein